MKYHIVTVILFLLFSVHSLKAQKNWVRCSDGLPADTVLSLVTIGKVLFVGTENSGVYKSTDYGNSWLPMPADNAFKSSSTWTMTAIDTFLFAALRGSGVLRTSINGTQWETTNYGIGRGSKIIQDIISVGTTLYAATFGGGVLVSTDSAKSWSVLYDHRGMDDRKIFSLASNSKYLFAGTAGVNTTMPDTGVVFVTEFGSDSWQTINNGLVRNGAHLEGVSAMCANDSVVFAGTDDVGIFRSTNNGQSWTQVPNTNLYGDIHSILIAGNQVYYGTLFGGIYSSNDGGITFTANNIGLNYQSTSIPYLVKDFVVLGDTIYAATTHGVYKQLIHSNVVSAGTTSEPNIPNIQVTQDNSIYNISMYFENYEQFQITVFNSFGQKTDISYPFLSQPGINFTQLTMGSFSSGVYFLQMKSMNNIYTKKIIIY
ncbi:MAG: T9SS type A sorting domain-containing protein [Ignavibacteria bacterium]|nr:T9SS type A sorting domain-containing protein [Ignavibacteria bacterium]